jgi:uncharacterized membrane protein
MEDLIVVTYRNQYSAVENMRTLRKLDDDWVVDIHDAVAVAKDSYGKLHVQDSYKATSQAGARWGVLLGTILGGLALAPFTGGLSTAAAAGAVAAGAAGGAALGGFGGATMASWEKQAVGLSEEFVSEVSEGLWRGESAIFALVSSRNPDRVLGYFQGTGGKVSSTNLSPYEEERVQQILTGSY